MSALLLISIMTVQWSLSDFEYSKDLVHVFCLSFSLVLSFIVYTALVLYARKLLARFIQTASSLLFAHGLVHLSAVIHHPKGTTDHHLMGPLNHHFNEAI